MKTLKLIALAFALITVVSCKKEQKETEIVNVEYKEEVKKEINTENATLATAEFNIDGMTCQVGCASKIEKSLAKMDGVATAKVDFENKSAVVTYDVDKVNTDLLAERVISNGDAYKVTNMLNVSAKKCTPDCKKQCCTKNDKKCTVKCSTECTKKDCKKCAVKTAECKAKCAAKKATAKTCATGCEKKCCKGKA